VKLFLIDKQAYLVIVNNIIFRLKKLELVKHVIINALPATMQILVFLVEAISETLHTLIVDVIIIMLKMALANMIVFLVNLNVMDV
jgi:hypothetical protein